MEESDSRMDLTSKMTKRRRNNDAIQRTKIFPFVLQRLFTKAGTNRCCAAGFSMHAFEEFLLLNWTNCFKNPCSARIEKNTATIAVASASGGDFCDWHAKVINFRGALSDVDIALVKSL